LAWYLDPKTKWSALSAITLSHASALIDPVPFLSLF